MTVRNWIVVAVVASAACSTSPSASEDPGSSGLGTMPATTPSAATAPPVNSPSPGASAVPAAAPNPPLPAAPASAQAAPSQSASMPPMPPATPTAEQPPSQPPAKPAIAFASFYVTDLEREVDFYVRLIGMMEAARFPTADGSMAVKLEFPDAPREAGLLLLSDSAHATLDHRSYAAYNRIGLKVSDLQGLVTKLRAESITIVNQPARTESLKLSYAIIQDPDGYRMECLQYDTPSGSNQPMMPLPRIGFVSFNVSDDMASVAFYDQLVGLKETGRFSIGNGTDEIFVGWPDAPGVTGLLLLSSANQRSAPTHGNDFSRFGLAVPDLQAVIAKATAANAKIDQQPTRVEPLKYTSALVSDKDGYQMELLQYD